MFVNRRILGFSKKISKSWEMFTREARKKRRIKKQIWKWSKYYDLDPHMVASVAWHESAGGYQYATRFESRWFKTLTPLTRIELGRYGGFVPYGLPSLHDEKRDRSTSFGYMQILGQTAREQGFRGRFLAELCDLSTNFEVGCKILAHKRAAAYQKGFSGRELTRKMLLFYNGGGDKTYPEKIFEILEGGDYKKLYS